MSALQEAPLWAEIDVSDKFVAPTLSRQWARRDRLARLVSLAVQLPLTLVTGPPGAGKSVLLSDWAHSYANGTVSWLTVDEQDNEPGKFWRSIVRALGVGGSGSAIPDGYWCEPDSGHSADEVLEQAVLSQPGILIVDDFHLVTDDATIKSLARLARRLPSHFRMVIAGRSEPPFQLRRLVSSGEASLIGGNELRFTLDESAALVAQVAHRFTSLAELEALLERSEGWAAGLHLAALALRDEDNPSEFVRRFSGTFPPVAEYLDNELLPGLSPDTMKFLLQTSVLARLTPEVCRAVTGRTDAGEILAAMARDNLFVVPAASSEPSHAGYRYHHLLADVLRSRLSEEDPALRREANFKAGCWFERSGDTRSAAHHFGSAAAYERASSSIFPHLGGLPVERLGVVGSEPQLRRVYMEAATLICAQRAGEAALVLQRLDQEAADGWERQLWRGRAEFLWAVHADRLGDASAVLDHCQAARELLQSKPDGIAAETMPLPAVSGPPAGSLDASIQAQLPVLRTRAYASLGQLDDAEAALLAGFSSLREAEADEPATVSMMACLGGRLSDAYRLGGAALQQARAHRGTAGPVQPGRPFGHGRGALRARRARPGRG